MREAKRAAGGKEAEEDDEDELDSAGEDSDGGADEDTPMISLAASGGNTDAAVSAALAEPNQHRSHALQSIDTNNSPARPTTSAAGGARGRKRKASVPPVRSDRTSNQWKKVIKGKRKADDKDSGANPAAPMAIGPAAVSQASSTKRASQDKFHDLINSILVGEEEDYFEEEDGDQRGAGDEGDTDEGDHAAGRGTSARHMDGGDSGPTPFVMGSSSSSDPILQQAVHEFRKETVKTEGGADDGTGEGRQKRGSISGVRANGDAEQSGDAAAKKAADQGAHHSSSFGSNPANSSVPSASGKKNSGKLTIDPIFPSSKQPPLPPLEVRRVTQESSGRAVFFAFVENPYSREDKTGKNGKAIGREGFDKLTDAIRGRRRHLMELYATRDAAAFPILSHSQRREYRQAINENQRQTGQGVSPAQEKEPNVPLPVLLAHASLATASVYEPSIRAIGKEAWADDLHALMEQFEYASILTLQVAITDLCGRPSINMSGNFKNLCQVSRSSFYARYIG